MAFHPRQVVHCLPILAVFHLIGGLAAAQDDPSASVKRVVLTEAERAWLSAHPSIRVGPDPDFPPFEFFDDSGRYRGIAADYLQLIERKLGIRFEIVRHASWTEVLEKAQAREVDMFGAAVESPQRREYMLFTSPHIRMPGIILATTDTKATLTLDELHGKKVAVVLGYIWQDTLANDHPEIELVAAPDTATALQMTSFGIAEAMVADAATTTYYIEREGLTNLRIAGRTEHRLDLALAVRNDWPELQQIVEKALAAISDEERSQLQRRWIQMQQASIFARREFWIAVLVGLAVMAFIVTAILGWNRMLKRQVAAKTEELRAELARRRSVERAVTGSTLELTGAAAQIAASARQQDCTIREFHESTNRAATAVQEISVTSKHLAQIIHEVSQVAQHTAQNASSGQDHLHGLDTAMSQMAESTAKVAANIELIRENTSRINLATNTMTRVVDRTGLLSVNSAIEAEKAGEHARGFRVVSGEIRRLASQSAAATLEIESIVKGIHESVSRGVDQVSRFRGQMNHSIDEVKRISAGLGKIIIDVAGLSSRFAEISEMMTAQSSGTEEIHSSIGQINSGAQQISDSSAEFAQVTDQLKSVAEQLKGQVSSFTDAAGAPASEDANTVP